MLEALKYDQNGLIPAIVADYYTKQVRMMAWMNRESLEISIREGMTCFFSRSRRQLWRKGETSGNRQHIVNILCDCDRDTLLIEAICDGPACHNGTQSCFTEELYQSGEVNAFSIDALYELIRGRKRNPKEGSYTTYLFSKGVDKILKKVGEECAEVIIGAKGGDRGETVFELSDLMYHALVLMAEMDIEPREVFASLASRHVIDKKVKQEKMQ